MVESQDSLKIKTAIVLNEMLSDAQAKGSKNARITDRKIDVHSSFGKISVETGITKGNLISIFWGRTGTKITTLIPILTALNKSFIEFARRFEKVTDSDIQQFKERSAQKKSAAPTKKKIARK